MPYRKKIIFCMMYWFLRVIFKLAQKNPQNLGKSFFLLFSVTLYPVRLPVNLLFTHYGEKEALCDPIDGQYQNIETVPPQ